MRHFDVIDGWGQFFAVDLLHRKLVRKSFECEFPHNDSIILDNNNTIDRLQTESIQLDTLNDLNY